MNLKHHNLVPDNLDAFWMPFSGQRQFKEDPRFIVSAKGMYYTDSQGHETLDGSAVRRSTAYVSCGGCAQVPFDVRTAPNCDTCS